MKTKIRVVTTPATSEVTEEREVDIQTPRYSKDKNEWLYKITEKGVVRLIFWDSIKTWNIQICVGDNDLKEAYNAPECSEQEFLTALNVAKAELENQLHEELLTI